MIKLLKGQYILLLTACVSAIILFSVEINDPWRAFTPVMAAIMAWVSVRLLVYIYREEVGKERITKLTKVILFMAVFDIGQYALSIWAGKIIAMVVGLVVFFLLVRMVKTKE